MDKSGFAEELSADKFGKDIFEALEITRRILAQETAAPVSPALADRTTE